ncbi:unnamed protein product [Tuber aestivum]|uniref:Calponin-homology (CH) domain-containing protein n=1 Tax=Tuber aestivum TaxID=59557 RepID=A0A292PKI2_9PEZI|nr:unnamed protein product [Tuber aestivum]
MSRFSIEKDGTPCPVRSSFTQSENNHQSTRNPPTSFPLIAPGSDIDDDYIDDLDYTRATPADFHLFPITGRTRRRRAVLHEPPRRITGFVPAHNQRASDEKGKEKAREREREWEGEKEREREMAKELETEKERECESVREQGNLRPSESNFYTDVALALQPQPIRAQSLHQQPRRVLMKRKLNAKSRRRISALLAARTKQQAEASTGSPNTAESKPTSQLESLQPAGNEALGDKTYSTANVGLRPPVDEFKRPEKKPFLAPPKRRTLQPQLRLSHHSGFDAPRCGNAGGKENIPPGEEGAKIGDQETSRRIPANFDRNLNERRSEIKHTAPFKPRATQPMPTPPRESMKRLSEAMAPDGEDRSFGSSIPCAKSTSSQRSSLEDPRQLRLKRRKMSNRLLPTPPSLSREEEAELAPYSLRLDPPPPIASFRHVNDKSTKLQLNPLLKEDISRTEMYEDSWLFAQESSVSQLLNSILSPTFAERSDPQTGEIRTRFVSVYSSPPFPLLFKRLQASLLYGALAVPKDVLEKSSAAKLSGGGAGLNGQGWGWAEDLAVRKKFLNLIMETYETVALVPGLEVVIGREMFVTTPKTVLDQRKVTEGFVERYLMRSEDTLTCPPIEDSCRRGAAERHSQGDNEDWGSPIWLLRKSILRSLMLVLLLDKAKTQGILGRKNLFKKSSPHKSSASILHTLSRLLLPSVGDILRPLGHLNYLPEISQCPLEEYEYEITNLAVDMRDGVRLTRVVELLLSPRSPAAIAGKTPQAKWPLSSNLKFPATSRAHKLHNVSIGLSALNSVGGNPRGVSAKDVVDGSREKTVGLLWGIVSRWGLEQLVDWNEVKREIRSLQARKVPAHTRYSALLVTDCCNNGPTNHVRLLKDWAGCIAAAHGIQVDNLTTSFGDGRVFQKIVEEYEQYFPVGVRRERDAPLKAKLRALGCSSYFAGLFDDVKRTDKVFSKDFVIAGLAYLCSRLFQWSIKERAAAAIQRSYRAYLCRRDAHKRINLLLLAHQCSNVVNTRNRIINAATTIQTAYRQYLHIKITKLIDSITNLQSAIRGKLLRQKSVKYGSMVVYLQQKWRNVREYRFQRRIGIAREATIGFQALARGLLLRNNHQNLRSAVSIVGRRRRMCLEGRIARAQHIILKEATLKIQRWWRDQMAIRDPRRELTLAVQSTIRLQSFIRGKFALNNYKSLSAAALFVQRGYRSCRDGRTAQLEFLGLRLATLDVQRRYRSSLQAREDRQRYIILRTRSIQLQRHWTELAHRRGAAIVLQRAWRRFAWLVRLRKMLGEVVTIQSLWRGYKTRQESSARVRIARRRVSKVMSTPISEGDTLVGRLNKGLELMTTAGGYGRGVMQLELATRYSRECVALATSNETAISTLLQNIEFSINQTQKSISSIPARNLVLGMNVLANISKSAAALRALEHRTLPAPAMGRKKVSTHGSSNSGGSQDILAILLDAIEVLRSAQANTPQSGLFLTTVGVLKALLANEVIRARFVARKKCIERISRLVDKNRTESTRKGVTASRAAGVGGSKAAPLVKLLALEGIITQLGN